MKLEVPIKVDIDDVTKLIHDLQCLQTYKLGVNDTTVLVSLDAVADVFADHIRAKRLDKDINVPNKEIIHCKDCKQFRKPSSIVNADWGWCSGWPTPLTTFVKVDGFCHRAEKRGSESE